MKKQSHKIPHCPQAEFNFEDRKLSLDDLREELLHEVRMQQLICQGKHKKLQEKKQDQLQLLQHQSYGKSLHQKEYFKPQEQESPVIEANYCQHKNDCAINFPVESIVGRVEDDKHKLVIGECFQLKEDTVKEEYNGTYINDNAERKYDPNSLPLTTNNENNDQLLLSEQQGINLLKQKFGTANNPSTERKPRETSNTSIPKKGREAECQPTFVTSISSEVTSGMDSFCSSIKTAWVCSFSKTLALDSPSEALDCTMSQYATKTSDDSIQQHRKHSSCILF